MKALAVFIVSTFLFAACKKETSWRESEFTKVDNSRAVVEANLPVELWEKITGLLSTGGEKKAEGGGGEHGGGSGGGSESESIDSVFAPIKVYFIEKNRGILKQGPTQIEFGPGGGEVDLADYLAAKNGSFYFAVDFLRDVEKLDRRVFFMSNSPERKLEDEKVGAGCEKYFDISSSFQKAVNGDGFLVNTSEARHVSALVGTYFFASVNEGKLNLAALTIKDSRFPKLHCR